LNKDALPLSHKLFCLNDYQKKTKQFELNKLHEIKELFFSGQFTKFIKTLLACDQNYFLDSVHLAIALQQLDLLKTKFNLTSLLYTQESKGILLKIKKQNDIFQEFSTHCLDY
jgi:hypothetical protein